MKVLNKKQISTYIIFCTGVEVLLTGPDADKLTGQVVGAQPFDSDVYPVDALKSDNHERIGGGWDVLENSEAVNEYGNNHRYYIFYKYSKYTLGK